VAFDGIDDATGAQALAGATIWVARDAVALAADEFFDEDLVGCTLVDAHGRELATVRAVEHYPAQDMLVVARGAGATAMVPMVRAFIRDVDVRAKRIVVDVPDGLLDARDADEA
jgi:16S rRNA processing protein RimM